MSATNASVASTATASAVASTATAAIPSLDKTYGVLMIGTFLGLILYGITLQQCYRYTRLPAYREDSTYTRSMVFVILILETVHSVISMHAIYYYLTTNYFNPTVLFHGVWSVDLIPMATGIIVAVSQSFFARRLWMIDRKFRWMAVLVCILLLCEAGFSIAITVEAFRQPDLLQFEDVTAWMFKAGMGVIVCADSLLTAVLTIVLRRSRTGFENTDTVLNTLIVYTINTGLLTGTLSLACFFVALFYPKTLLANGMNMCIAKLYAISLLAVLNSRDFLKNRKTKSVSTGAIRSGGHPSVGVLGTNDRYNNMHGPSGSRGIIDIKLTREIVHDRSDDYELEKIPDKFPQAPGRLQDGSPGKHHSLLGAYVESTDV
ncbi:hypothetical protein C2E23DRAFT_889623 [Lenzites betulinus]|nr:hypothetical protein C2E23DRAFT_889623 [Lenzites betulinus]